jgi:ArsR family transcriptional regulator
VLAEDRQFDYSEIMESNDAVAALSALAQASRLAFFGLLVEAGPSRLAVGEIGSELAFAPATRSFHLKTLRHANLIVARQAGRFIDYPANDPQMNAVLNFLPANCGARDPVCRARQRRPTCVARSSARPNPTSRSPS